MSRQGQSLGAFSCSALAMGLTASNAANACQARSTPLGLLLLLVSWMLLVLSPLLPLPPQCRRCCYRCCCSGCGAIGLPTSMSTSSKDMRPRVSPDIRPAISTRAALMPR